jgi:hypothetical protein
MVELLAAANHRPPLKAVVGRLARDVRRMQVTKLGALLEEYGIDPDELPPALVAAGMQGLAFGIVQDEVAGYETDHAEARAAMDRLVAGLERRRGARP